MRQTKPLKRHLREDECLGFVERDDVSGASTVGPGLNVTETSPA